MAEYNKPLYTDDPDVPRDLENLFNTIDGQFVDSDESDEALASTLLSAQNYTNEQIKSVQKYMRIDISDDENIGVIEGDFSDETQTDPFNVSKDVDPSGGSDGDFWIVFYSSEKIFKIWKNAGGTWGIVNDDVTINVANFFKITDTTSPASTYIFMGDDWEPMTWEADMANYYSKSETDTLLDDKQDTLVGSGTNQNIKTIDGQNILGSGDIQIGGGTGQSSNFYGVIFGTEDDVADGNATAVFSSATFQSALNDETITKIGLYGGNSERTYALASSLTGAFSQQKLICATNGQVTLSTAILYDVSATGLANHFYQQVAIAGVIGGNIDEKINFVSNETALAHMNDITTNEYEYQGGEDLTDFFNNQIGTIFKTGGTLILPAGTYSLGDVNGDFENIQTKTWAMDFTKWLPNNLTIICKDGTATINYTGTSADSCIISLNNNCLMANISITATSNNNGRGSLIGGSHTEFRNCNITRTASTTGNLYGIYFISNSEGAKVQNCTIDIAQTGTGSCYGIYAPNSSGANISATVTASSTTGGCNGIAAPNSSGANISATITASSTTGGCIGIAAPNSSGANISATITASSTTGNCYGISASNSSGTRIIITETNSISSANTGGYVAFVYLANSSGVSINVENTPTISYQSTGFTSNYSYPSVFYCHGVAGLSFYSGSLGITFKGAGTKSVIALTNSNGVSFTPTITATLSSSATTSNTAISSTNTTCKAVSIPAVTNLTNYAIAYSTTTTTTPTTNYARFSQLGSTVIA